MYKVYLCRFKEKKDLKLNTGFWDVSKVYTAWFWKLYEGYWGY
jgi:hypothetical protein